MPFAPNEHLKGKFYWPADHYSVPADDMCCHYNEEFFDCPCVLKSGHDGPHIHVFDPVIKDHSHKTVEQDEALAASERILNAAGVPT